MTDVPPPASSAPTSPVPAADGPRRKASLGKWLLQLVAVLALLVVIGLLLVYLNLNSLVRMGVVRGGQYATDQNTDLHAADLSLSGGKLQLMGLDIDNLKGYKSPKLLVMKDCAVSVQSSSLFSRTVVVDSVTIDGLEMTLEQDGMRNNLNELMEIIKKKTAAAGDASNAPPGKELKIGVLKLTGTKVHLRANPFNLDIDLPPLEMTDPTNPDGRPMKIADLVGKILLHLAKQIVENPQIPGDIKNQMKNVEALVNNLRGELDKNVKVLTGNLQEVGKNLQDLGKNFDPNKLKDAGKGLQDATKGLQDAGKNLQNATKGLGDVFNQKKEGK